MKAWAAVGLLFIIGLFILTAIMVEHQVNHKKYGAAAFWSLLALYEIAFAVAAVLQF
jgi:hypothetical protein